MWPCTKRLQNTPPQPRHSQFSEESPQSRQATSANSTVGCSPAGCSPDSVDELVCPRTKPLQCSAGRRLSRDEKCGQIKEGSTANMMTKKGRLMWQQSVHTGGYATDE
mmetsp:Transcript_15834/g.26487  ORF Transcript_15834/g.26487 Transcript_15834/m.26487 type:complete len:108 (-) Transcript_15834:110-433(-)